MITATPVQPPPPRPAVMGPYRPDWIEKPSAEDLSEYYPAHAASHQISGKATIVCKVMAEGRLNDCRVTSETPAGEQFGKAALKLSSKFRMIPPDDLTAAPATVTVPLVFEVPQTHVMIRPDDSPEVAQLLIWSGTGLAGISALLLVVMIWALARYHDRAARRSAEKP
jgi:protein TonB